MSEDVAERESRIKSAVRRLEEGLRQCLAVIERRKRTAGFSSFPLRTEALAITDEELWRWSRVLEDLIEDMHEAIRSNLDAEAQTVMAESPLPRKPKIGDIVHFQLLSVSRDGVKERPALVIGDDSLEGRLHLRGFFGPTDATPGHSEADTFFANYGHYSGDWHWPEEDGLWM